MRHLLAGGLVLALVLQTGCAAMVRYDTPSLQNLPSGQTTTIRSLGFFWGLIAPARISLDQCGADGIQRMKVKQGFFDWLITTATGGIVVSYKVKITCPEGPGKHASSVGPAAAPAEMAPTP